MTSLAVSQGILWSIVILLSIVVAALARQVGVLHERIAPMGAMASNKRLVGGSVAPRHTLSTLRGSTITVGATSGTQSPRSQLLFFLSPACPICKNLLPTVKSIQRQERAWLEVILASDGDAADSHHKLVEDYRLDQFHYVLSEALGIAYGVTRLPYAVLIDDRGIIRALGLVNSREHLESLFEAERLKVSTLQEYVQDNERRELSSDRSYVENESAEELVERG